MSSNQNKLSPAEIGDRLRRAREDAGATQALAASAIEVARTTLVAIEQGTRKPRVSELQRLAHLYGISLNTLLRNEAVQVDLIPRFRRDADASEEVSVAATLLSSLVKAEVELEDLLGISRRLSEPPERPLLPGDVVAQAEQDAQELRRWLGLGSGPIQDLLSLMDIGLGLRVFVRDLPSKVSGLYAYDEKVGGCILLNAQHNRARRNQTAGHEVGHYISARKSSDAMLDGEDTNSREERYAAAFAKAFLTPARAVSEKFAHVTAGATQLTRRHVIMLAHFFGVSREAIVRRLEELKLARPGTWDWFEENGRITDAQAREVLGDSISVDEEKADAVNPVSARMAVLASEAWRKDLLSEGQLASLLHIDRVDARALIDQYESEGNEADGALDLPT